jgi:hypothetical protein
MFGASSVSDPRRARRAEAAVQHANGRLAHALTRSASCRGRRRRGGRRLSGETQVIDPRVQVRYHSCAPPNTGCVVAKWQSRDFAASAANAYQAPIGTGLLKKESPPARGSIRVLFAGFERLLAVTLFSSNPLNLLSWPDAWTDPTVPSVGEGEYRPFVLLLSAPALLKLCL